MLSKKDKSITIPVESHLPKATDRLDEFVEKLLNRVADESEEGRKALVSSIHRAQEIYKKPIESWVTGWFYAVSRTRGTEIEKAVASIETFPDAYTRLQEIKNLANKGEWNPDSSFNYYLFVELIKSVPGYRPLRANLVEGIALEVKDKIIEKIDSFMYQYKANQKLKEARDKEMAATHPSGIKSVDDIILLNNIKDASESAQANLAKTHFCMNFTNDICYISWVDRTGKIYKLAPTNELITLLVEHKIDDVEKVNPVMAKRLKRECLRARDIFLERVPLIVNPKDSATHEEISNKRLIAKGTVATFILRGKPNAYSLYWVNTLGQVSELSLNAYQELMLWLNAQSTLNEALIPQLKAYLLNVNTSKSISGMDDFKNELSKRLSKEPRQGIILPKAITEKPIPKPLDMSKFTAVEALLGGRNGEKQLSHPSESDELIMNSDATPNFYPLVSVDDIPPPVDDLEFDPKIDELSLPMFEELPAHVKAKPVPPKVPIPNRLELGTYADVVKLFGHKPKNDEPTSIEENRSINQPNN